MDADAAAPDFLLESDDSTADELVAPPSVVAVVVTHNAGPWFEATLESLGAQDYPGLTVLVLDAASDEDPTPRVADALPAAFVRRLDERGFARAANEAITAVEGANFLCFCHDDVVLDPSAIRTLVEESFRSNAAIVGPKIVDAADPRLLLEVGWSIDRFGEPHSGIEPGEYDQEQHDGVRDVFFVSSVMMLVRTDLFGELGGFDIDTFPGAEDLDLCWRARLLGARVMVVPDARIAHHHAAGERPGVEEPDNAQNERNRVRAFLKNSSTLSLLVWVPLALMGSAIEAAFFFVTGRRSEAKHAITAWWGTALHPGRVRSARKTVQSTRIVHDSELRYLRTRGSARARRYVRRALLGDDRIARLGEARHRAADVSARLRRPIGVLGVVLAALFFIGSRDLFFGRVRAVGSMVPWEGMGTLFGIFGAGWRGSGLGAPVAAAPGFGAAGTLSALLFGASDLALTVVVLGSVVVGVIGVWRVTRALCGPGGFAPSAAAVAYLVTPVWRNAIAQGRLGALVVFALLPMVVATIVRAADAEPDVRRRARIRAGLLVAIATAFAPVMVAVVLLAAAVLVFTVPLVGGGAMARRFLFDALWAVVIAVALVSAWFVTTLIVGATPNAFGVSMRPPTELAAVMKWSTGPAGAGWLPWGLVLAALAPVLAAGGDRFRWAVRGVAWYLAAVLAAWGPSRIDASMRWFAPETFGALGALGVAIAVAMGAAAVSVDLPRTRFGWRHVVTLAGVGVLALPLLGFVADIGTGRWQQPSNDWANQLSWTETSARRGQGRVLWLGDARVLPLDAIGSVAGTDYALSANGPAGTETLMPGPTGALEARFQRALDRAAAGNTTRLADVLADMGVRYVVVVQRPAPGSGPSLPIPVAVRSGLDAQRDLAPQEAPDGVEIYENAAWVPVTAVEAADGSQIATRSGAKVPAGRITYAANPYAAWDASVNGRSLPTRATTRGNAWDASEPGTLDISYSHNWIGLLLAFATVAAWALAFWAQLRHRSRPHTPEAEIVLPDDEIDLREHQPVSATSAEPVA